MASENPVTEPDLLPHPLRPIVPCVNVETCAQVEASLIDSDGIARWRSPRRVGDLADEILSNTGEPSLEILGPDFMEHPDLPGLVGAVLAVARKHRARPVFKNLVDADHISTAAMDSPRAHDCGHRMPNFSFPIFPPPPAPATKVVPYLFQYAKRGAGVFLTQLAVMRYLERAIRRAGLELVYSGGKTKSAGFSFGPGTPVGVESAAEHVLVLLRDHKTPTWIRAEVRKFLPAGLDLLHISRTAPDIRKLPALREVHYEIEFASGDVKKMWAETESRLRSGPCEVRLSSKSGETRKVRLDGIMTAGRLEGGRAILKLLPRGGDFPNLPAVLGSLLGLSSDSETLELLHIKKISEIRVS